MKKKEQEHLIQTVYPGSIAEELEIEPGDVLLKINGQKIEDVFDYRYLMKDEYVEVLIRKPSGEEWLLEIDKEYDDELGVEFENGLMSEYRSCSNKCMFCSILQRSSGLVVCTEILIGASCIWMMRSISACFIFVMVI